MYYAFLKGTSPRMAMQAFAVVVRLVELDIRGLWWISQVIDINVAEAPKLGLEATKHCVVGVAGVTRFVSWNQMILEVGCRQMSRIIHLQASAVGLHDVTAEAKFRALGVLHLRAKTHSETQQRQAKQQKESHDLPAAGCREARSKHQQSNQSDTKCDENKQ